jgi:hypothetical protein
MSDSDSLRSGVMETSVGSGIAGRGKAERGVEEALAVSHGVEVVAELVYFVSPIVGQHPPTLQCNTSSYASLANCLAEGCYSYAQAVQPITVSPAAVSQLFYRYSRTLYDVATSVKETSEPLISDVLPLCQIHPDKISYDCR